MSIGGQPTGPGPDAVDEHPTLPPKPPAAEAETRPPLTGQENEALPRLGRYRILGELGTGGFGTVYRCRDDELRRDVAVKVPRRERIRTPADAEAYLEEARTLATLKHPHIVPVYDVGRTDDGLCFVVSMHIEGCDLARKIRNARPALAESVELVATIADALQYAHNQGLVHRDVKPGNILIDQAGTPYLADFGLALREEDYGKGGGLSAAKTRRPS